MFSFLSFSFIFIYRLSLSSNLYKCMKHHVSAFLYKFLVMFLRILIVLLIQFCTIASQRILERHLEKWVCLLSFLPHRKTLVSCFLFFFVVYRHSLHNFHFIPFFPYTHINLLYLFSVSLPSYFCGIIYISLSWPLPLSNIYIQ